MASKSFSTTVILILLPHTHTHIYICIYAPRLPAPFLYDFHHQVALQVGVRYSYDNMTDNRTTRNPSESSFNHLSFFPLFIILFIPYIFLFIPLPPYPILSYPILHSSLSYFFPNRQRTRPSIHIFLRETLISSTIYQRRLSGVRVGVLVGGKRYLL